MIEDGTGIRRHAQAFDIRFVDIIGIGLGLMGFFM